jgi:putative two-component system response regulator
LVVDDSITDQMIISNMLQGFHVLRAKDGVEAMKIINENLDIDLIILDLNMPVMNGFQVLETLKLDKKYEKIRVIILTNYDELKMRYEVWS